MILARAERYTIEPHHDGVVVRMRQTRNSLAVAVLCAGVLALSWRYLRPESFEWFFYVWCGFFALALVLSLLGSLYREDVVVTHREIVAETLWFGWRRRRQIPAGQPLGIWVETIESEGEGTTFTYRVHLLDAGGRRSGVTLQLGRRASVDTIVDAIRAVLRVEVRKTPAPDGRSGT